MKKLLSAWRQTRARKRAARELLAVLRAQGMMPEQQVQQSQIQDDDESWDDDEDLRLEEEALCELEQDGF